MSIRLSPKTKRNISRIIPFGIIWFLLGNIFLFIDVAAVGDAEVPASAIQLNFEIYLFASIGIFFVGILIGTIEVLFLNKRFADRSLLQKLTFKTLIYASILFTIILILFPIAASMYLNTGVTDLRVWEKYFLFLQSKTYASTNIQLAVELVASLFYFELSENIGHGTMIKFLTGRYHQPTQESRVFMFLDMKSSTTIAEQLGHLRYFDFLKSYYNDLADAIISYEGEIYDYVGDEVIISWPIEKGISDYSCLQCFLAMKNDLQRRYPFYLKQFGVQPTFKAGLHCGVVTTGEIGVLKKEIIFTGDVLNATARIQALCNDYGVDILISGKLIAQFPGKTDFQFQSLGKNELRGKSESITLYTFKN